MKKQFIILGIISILITVGLSGCNNVTNSSKSDKDKLVGTWSATRNNVTAAMTFFSDGTVNITTMGGHASGTYEIKDGKLVYTASTGTLMTYDYSFSSDGKELTLRKLGDNYDVIYTKQ
jgi:hypothetical protein